MLEIIAYIGCAMLLVAAFVLIDSDSNARKVAGVIAVTAALVLGILTYYQGMEVRKLASSSTSELTAEEIDCLSQNLTDIGEPNPC